MVLSCILLNWYKARSISPQIITNSEINFSFYGKINTAIKKKE